MLEDPHVDTVMVRRVIRAALLVAMVASISCGGGVTLVGLPNPADRHAPGEVVESVQRPSCDRLVEILPPHAQPARTYQMVASISVTCHNGVTSVCERRLRERACELAGDAVMMFEVQSASIPPGAAVRRDVIQSGQVIRYAEAQAADANTPPDASVPTGAAIAPSPPMSP